MLIKPLTLAVRIGLLVLCLHFTGITKAAENPSVNSNNSNLLEFLCDLQVEDVIVSHETCDVSNDGSITIRAASSSRIEYSFDGGSSFGLSPLRTNLSQANYEIVVRLIDDPSCQESFEVEVDFGDFEKEPFVMGSSLCKDFDPSKFSGLMASAIGAPEEKAINLEGVEEDFSSQWWNRTEDCTILRTTESVAYVAKAFTVNETGNYSFLNEQENWDGVISIYRDQFDPSNPFNNCIAYNDDGTQVGLSAIEDINLEQCNTYFFVITGKAHDDFGTFSTEVTGPGQLIEPETGVCFPVNSGIGGEILWFEIDDEDYSNPVATGNKYNPVGTAQFNPEEDIHTYYAAIAYKNCFSDKIPVELITGDCDVEISDPCSCRNNATNLFDGQFDESIMVSGPSGVIWTVSANIGLFQPLTPMSAQSTQLVPLGTQLREVVTGGGLSDYFLDGVHTDAIGYEVQVTDGSTVLTQGNTCFYPNPVILNLADYVCTQTPAFTLQGDADQSGTGVFYINNVVNDFFDPAGIGPGIATVEYEFDADGSPGPGVTEPGCIQSVEQMVTIDDDPNVACITNINVGLGADCEVEITVSMVQAADQCMTPGAYSIVVKDLDSNIVANNIVTCVGTYFAEVTNNSTGNSCWGYVHVEDKIAPEITCPDNITIHCTDSRDTSVTGVPTAMDNCDTLRYSYSDREDLNACGVGTVTRTWVVRDKQGNSDECEQIITIEDQNRVVITWPRDLDLDCIQDLDALHPDSLARPYSRPRYSADCRQLADGFNDEFYDICSPGSFKILRNWKIYDWCDTDTVFEYVQTIKVVDTINPTIICPDDQVLQLSHNSRNCEIRIPNTVPDISDNCDPNPTYNRTVYDENDNIITRSRVGPGKYRVFFEAFDACGNSDTCSYMIEVFDPIAPSAVCDQNTNVTLTNSGFAEICYTTFDDNSTDNCAIDRYEIKKDGEDDSRYRDCVTFRCRDLGINKVHLRVTDIYGNSNTCWANVYVEDKAPPIIICPPDVTVSCLVDIEDPENTGGLPDVDGRCQNLNVDFVDASSHASCPAQVITRTWRVEKTVAGADGIPGTADDITYTDECDQIITVVDSTDITIEWPSDLTIPCSQGAISTAPGDLIHYNNGSLFYDRPRISDEDCEHLGINMTDRTYQVCGPGSYKVRRTWNIVDWCSDLDTSYVQTIWIRDDEAPELEVFNAVVDITTNVPACEAYVSIEAIAFDDCTQVTVRNNSPFAITQNANASGYYPKGETMVTFTATDACGNSIEKTVSITVRDRKNPLAVCGNGYAINLKSTGIAQICAEVFDRGSTDNCTFTQNLQFYIQRLDEQLNPVGNREECLTFDCNDLEDSPIQTVNFIVEDADGNVAYCQTNLVLQDNDDYCDGGSNHPTLASIQGDVKTENGSMVDDLEVYVNNNMYAEDMFGHYEIDSLSIGNMYEIRMNRGGRQDEGVSVLDMILVRSHILKLDSLDSPYQMIAADVNEDGKISTIDIIEMRQMILRIISEFSGGINWTFIPQDYVFPDQYNPWIETYPNYARIQLNRDVSDVDFIAVKKGDVDRSAFIQEGTERGEVLLSVDDQELYPGNAGSFVLDFQSDEVLQGMQFGLDVIGIKAGDVKYIGGTANDNEIRIEQNGSNTSIQVAWMSEELSGEDQFQLEFEIIGAEKSTLSEIIQLRQGLVNEVYYDHGNRSSLGLEFEGVHQSEKYVLLQNIPNPLSDRTSIGFVMPKDDVASIEIFDLAGKKLWERVDYFKKGKNSIVIDSGDLGADGVLIYQFRSGSYIESKRMMVIK